MIKEVEGGRENEQHINIIINNNYNKYNICTIIDGAVTWWIYYMLHVRIYDIHLQFTPRPDQYLRYT